MLGLLKLQCGLNLQFPSLHRYFVTSFPRYRLSVIDSYHFEIQRIFQRFFIIRNLLVIFSQIGNVYGNKCNEVARKRGNEETRKQGNEVTR